MDAAVEFIGSYPLCWEWRILAHSNGRRGRMEARRTVRCPSCQHENRPGAKFCKECGASLARACANCETELSPTAKFCPECGHPAGQGAASVGSPPQGFGAPLAHEDHAVRARYAALVASGSGPT